MADLSRYKFLDQNEPREHADPAEVDDFLRGAFQQAFAEKNDELITRLACQAAELDQRYLELDRERKDVDKQRRHIKCQLAIEMQKAGYETIKLSNGLQPRVKEDRRYYFNGGSMDSPVLHEILRDIGLGHLVKQTVSFNSLQASLTEHEDKGGEIPDSFSVKVEPSVVLGGKTKYLENGDYSNGNSVSNNE